VFKKQRAGKRNSDNAEPDRLDDGMALARHGFFFSLSLCKLLGKHKDSDSSCCALFYLSQEHPERMFFSIPNPLRRAISLSIFLSLDGTMLLLKTQIAAPRRRRLRHPHLARDHLPVFFCCPCPLGGFVEWTRRTRFPIKAPDRHVICLKLGGSLVSCLRRDASSQTRPDLPRE